MTPSSVNEFGRNLMTQATALLNSPRIRDAESGAILFEFLSQRFVTTKPFDIARMGTFASQGLRSGLKVEGMIEPQWWSGGILR